MSTISASTTTTTAYKVTADTTGTLVLQTGATPTTAVTIDTAQNVGVGVTPSAWSGFTRAIDLQYNGTLSAGDDTSRQQVTFGYNFYETGAGTPKYKASSLAASMYKQRDGVHSWSYAPSGTAGNAITFTQAMTLDASGKLNIGGTTTPSAGASQLSLSGYSGNDGGLQLNASGGAGSLIATPGGAGIRFLTYTGSVGSESYTERARIDSSGNLLVGTTSQIASGQVCINYDTNHQGMAFKPAGNNTTFVLFKNASSTDIGSISTSGGSITLYNTTSDYRLKTVIGAVSGAGERIDALEPIEYTWNFDGSQTRGFLAHKFQEVYAGSVSGTKDAVDENGNPVYQSMQASTPEVIADLVAEIQSLRQRLAALENK